MEISLSKAGWWAAIAAVLAIGLMALQQWALALVMAALGGIGYVLARSIEDVLAGEGGDIWNFKNVHGD